MTNKHIINSYMDFFILKEMYSMEFNNVQDIVKFNNYIKEKYITETYNYTHAYYYPNLIQLASRLTGMSIENKSFNEFKDELLLPFVNMNFPVLSCIYQNIVDPTCSTFVQLSDITRVSIDERNNSSLLIETPIANIRLDIYDMLKEISIFIKYSDSESYRHVFSINTGFESEMITQLCKEIDILKDMANDTIKEYIKNSYRYTDIDLSTVSPAILLQMYNGIKELIRTEEELAKINKEYTDKIRTISGKLYNLKQLVLKDEGNI